ncbi:MAG: tetratricopeptide repeat protein [Proteobacteria bacterium]|nr:tetratricopeptide repeat protein [Pseudomonadota bacterium]
MLKKQMMIVMVSACVCVLLACGAKEIQRQPRHQQAAENELVEGNTWYMRGCYNKASDYFEKALERFSACDNLEGVAKSMNNLGSLHRASKELDSALMFFDESFRLFKRINLPLGQVQALSNKAAVYMDMDQLAQAESVLDQADTLALKNAIIYPPLLSNRALLLIRQAKTREAETLLSQALIQTSAAKAFEYATINHAMGLLMETRGDNDRAITYYTTALDTDRNSYFIRGIAADLSALGRVYLAMGQNDDAADALYRGLKIQTLVGDADAAEKTSVLLKRCLEAMGEKTPDMRITDHFLTQWANGDIVSGPCD